MNVYFCMCIYMYTLNPAAPKTKDLEAMSRPPVPKPQARKTRRWWTSTPSMSDPYPKGPST